VQHIQSGYQIQKKLFLYLLQIRIYITFVRKKKYEYIVRHN